MRYKVSHNPSSQLISEISAPLSKGIYEPWNQFLVFQIFFRALIFLVLLDLIYMHYSKLSVYQIEILAQVSCLLQLMNYINVRVIQKLR